MMLLTLLATVIPDMMTLTNLADSGCSVQSKVEKDKDKMTCDQAFANFLRFWDLSEA